MNYRDSTPEAIRKNAILPAPLRLFLGVTVVVYLVWAASSGFRRYIQHNEDGLMSPVYSLVKFYDLNCFRGRFLYFHSPAFFGPYPRVETYMYPPLVAVIYKFFYGFSHHTNRVFYIVTLAALSFMIIVAAKALRFRGLRADAIVFLLGAVLMFSYPLRIEYFLGNTEIFVFFLLALGVWAFFRARGYTAAVCFGLAGAMKIFPLVYVGLLLSRKQYRQVVTAFAVTIASTIAAFWLVCPDWTQSVRGIENGLADFRLRYMLQYQNETGFDHSIFALLKTLFHGLRNPETASHALSIYLPCAAIVGLAVYFLRIQYLPLANQILCLCAASVLLPPTSHDYTLLQLYVPWLVLVLYSIRTQKVRGLGAALLCLAVLFAPESEFIRHGHRIDGQIKAVVLVILMGLGLKYPFHSKADLPHSLRSTTV